MPQKHQNTKSHKKKFEPISQELENIGKKIVHAAYLVHKTLGPGLLEKVYEICFCHELIKMGLKVKRQVDIPIIYDGITFDWSALMVHPSDGESRGKFAPSRLEPAFTRISSNVPARGAGDYLHHRRY